MSDNRHLAIQASTTIPAIRTADGCEEVHSGESYKMRLRNKLGMPDPAFLKEITQLLSDRQASVSRKVMAVQNMSLIQHGAGEATLMQLAREQHPQLSFAALQTLAITGTPIAFQDLQDLSLRRYPKLTRQKDYAALVIACRYQLDGASAIAARLTRGALTDPQVHTFPLRFGEIQQDEIGKIVAQIQDSETGIGLSRKHAISVQGGDHEFYFLFNSTLDEISSWSNAFERSQVIGGLFRKEPGTQVITRPYLALAIPKRGHIQFSIFRPDGEVFMLAEVRQDRKAQTLRATNPKREHTSPHATTSIRLGQVSIVLDLTYIRHKVKKHTRPIA